MAGSKRPSFLKRQKEQKRLAKAKAKREARRERKENATPGADDIEQMEPLSQPAPELLEELLGAPASGETGDDDETEDAKDEETPPAGRARRA